MTTAVSLTPIAKTRIKLPDQTLTLVKEEVSKLREGKTFSKGINPRNIDFFMSLLEGGFSPVERNYDGSLISSPHPTVYVDWGHAVIAENPCLLATNDLGSCASLKLTGNMEYLLHALSNATNTDIIEGTLRESERLGLDLSNAEIDIMPGSTLDTRAPINIIEALSRIDLSLLDKVSLVRDFSGRGQGLAVKDGKIFQYNEGWHHETHFSCRTVSNFHSYTSLDANSFQELI